MQNEMVNFKVHNYLLHLGIFLLNQNMKMIKPKHSRLYTGKSDAPHEPIPLLYSLKDKLNAQYTNKNL